MVLKLKNIIVLFLKGVAIGGSMSVPGVSGGSIAIIFGIYDRLIKAVANLLKERLKSIVLLLTVGLGGALGVLILSGPISSLLKTNPYETAFFFMGACIGSLPMLFKKADFKIKFKDFLFVIIGVAVVLILNLLPKFSFNGSIFAIIIIGFLSSIALILPGVSFSYFLVVFDIYEPFMNAVSSFDIALLAPFFISLLAGVFCFSGLLSKLLEKHPKFSFLVIIGFLLGSLTALFPGVPTNANILPSILSFIAGLYIIYLTSKISY